MLWCFMLCYRTILGLHGNTADMHYAVAWFSCFVIDSRNACCARVVTSINAVCLLLNRVKKHLRGWQVVGPLTEMLTTAQSSIVW